MLLTLPGMQACVPVFDQDVEAAVQHVGGSAGPAYLRLGRGEPPPGFDVPAFAPWRQLTGGGGPVVAAVGPLAGTYIAAFEAMPAASRPNLWAVALLPVESAPPPPALLDQIAAAGALVVAEEHVRRGGFGAEFALWLAERALMPPRFVSLHAGSQRSERYGSQAWLRRQSGLDPATMLSALASCRSPLTAGHA